MQLQRPGRTLDKGFRCISLQDERHQSGCLSRGDGNTQLSEAPFDRMRLRMGALNSCRANAKSFFMNHPDKQTWLKTARFRAGPFSPTRVQTEQWLIHSSQRSEKENADGICYQFIISQTQTLFYFMLIRMRKANYNIILMEISDLRPHFWSLLNKNCSFLVIKLLLNIPFLFILIF